MPVRMIHCLGLFGCIVFASFEAHAEVVPEVAPHHSDWTTSECLYEGDRTSPAAWAAAKSLMDAIAGLERDGILLPILFDKLHAIRTSAEGILASSPAIQLSGESMIWAKTLMTGPAEPIYSLARCHQAGLTDLPDENGIYHLLMYEAARKGHVPAAWELRLHYQDENGYPLKRAGVLLRQLYRIPARAGVVEAQVAMGYLTLARRQFSSSQAVDSIVNIAYDWFLLARKNGADVENMIELLEQKIDPELATFKRQQIEQENKIP